MALSSFKSKMVDFLFNLKKERTKQLTMSTSFVHVKSIYFTAPLCVTGFLVCRPMLDSISAARILGNLCLDPIEENNREVMRSFQLLFIPSISTN